MRFDYKKFNQYGGAIAIDSREIGPIKTKLGDCQLAQPIGEISLGQMAYLTTCDNVLVGDMGNILILTDIGGGHV